MIPVVDFAPICKSSTNDDWRALSSEIFKALSQFGFMFIINHDIEADKIKMVFMESERFFKLDLETKEKYPIDISKDYVGYTQAGKEILNNEVYELRETISTDNPERFLEIPEIPLLMPAMEELRMECQPLLRKLYRLIGMALQLKDEDSIVKIHNRGNLHQGQHSLNRSMVKVNYYPPTTDKMDCNKTTRLSAHTDYGSVTLLFQDSIAGLEVKTDGKWMPIEPLDGAVLVNIGDAIDIMTCGVFPANLHRVVLPQEGDLKRSSRMSVAYFVWPDQDTLLLPLESNLIKPTKDQLDSVILFREHGERRMQEGYTVLGDS